MSELTDHQEKAIQRVVTAAAAVKSGGMVIMTDDESRENEGDLIFAADHVSAEKINFMVKEARGLVCLTLAAPLVDKLQLPLMTDHSKSRTPMQTAFTVSIEAKTGVSTGISAADRCRTIQVATADDSGPADLVVPGHIFPLRAKDGGVLERAGHTEGSVDLMRLAGQKPAAVICEIMNDDGTMARLPDLQTFAARYGFPLVSIADLITYRLLRESLVAEIGRRPFPTAHGTFSGHWYRNRIDGSTHFALVKGGDFAAQTIDVRVHKQRPLTDALGASNFDNGAGPSRWPLDYGLKMLARCEQAVLVYLSADSGPLAFDTALLHEDDSPMDPRLYGIGAQILKTLGVRRMRLHVGRQRALIGLGGFGLEITSMELMKDYDDAQNTYCGQ